MDHPEVIIFGGRRYILESSLRDNPEDERDPRAKLSDPETMSVYRKCIFETDDERTPMYSK